MTPEIETPADRKRKEDMTRRMKRLIDAQVEAALYGRDPALVRLPVAELSEPMVIEHE